MIQSAAWIWCGRKMWFGITSFVWGPAKKTTDSRQTFNLNFELRSQVWNWCSANWISRPYQYSQYHTIYQVSFNRIFKLLGTHTSVPRGVGEKIRRVSVKTALRGLHSNILRNQICQVHQHVNSIIHSKFRSIMTYLHIFCIYKEKLRI